MKHMMVQDAVYGVTQNFHGAEWRQLFTRQQIITQTGQAPEMVDGKVIGWPFEESTSPVQVTELFSSEQIHDYLTAPAAGKYLPVVNSSNELTQAMLELLLDQENSAEEERE